MHMDVDVHVGQYRHNKEPDPSAVHFWPCRKQVHALIAWSKLGFKVN